MAENADFARAASCRHQLRRPRPGSLEAFGDKIAFQALAVKAGVPTVPGTEDAVAILPMYARRQGRGLSIIIKASFGGGGRGMRVVQNADDWQGQLEKPAGSGGGVRPADVFVERYVPARQAGRGESRRQARTPRPFWEPRLAPCSGRHRSRRIAPSINLAPDLLRRICERCRAPLQTVRYQSRHREFLVDMIGRIPLIEVNPRNSGRAIPVTEIGDGVDLVRAQLLVAQGHSCTSRRSPFRTDAIVTTGWRCNAALPPRIRKTISSRTYGRISPTARPAALRYGSTGRPRIRPGRHHAVLRLALVKITTGADAGGGRSASRFARCAN